MKIIQCYTEMKDLSEIKEVEKIKMLCKHTYADTLIELNKIDDIINIEHDIIVTQKDLDELANCKHDLCVFNYYLYPFSTGWKEPVLAHRCKVESNNFTFIDANYDEEYVDLAGFGAIKFKKGMLNKLHFTEEEREWIAFDSVVSQKFHEIGISFHLHKKILKHTHTGGYPCK